jgi:ribosomal-protein-serine acetyltransferase
VSRPPPLIVDAETRLDPRVAADAPELFRLVDANRAYLRRWLPWLDATRSVADVLAFGERVERARREGSGLTLLVRQRGALRGVLGFNPLDAANHSGDLGYWLAEDAQGRGLMTAAVRALLDHGFAELGLNRAVIRAASGNRRSRAIPDRLGFRHEGTLRQAEWLYDHYVDLEVYSLLRPEWARMAGR